MSDEEDPDFDQVWQGEKVDRKDNLMNNIDKMTHVLLKPMYALLTVLGVALVILGIVFLNPFVTSMNKPSTALIIGGLAMLGLGFVGMAALRGEHALMLIGVEALNICLFAFLIAGGMLALSLATNTHDPVSTAILESWKESWGRDESEKHGYCKDHGGVECAKFYGDLKIIRVINGTSQGCYDLVKPWDHDVAPEQDGNYKQTWNCTQIDPSVCPAMLEYKCLQCDSSCQLAAVSDIKTYLQPAAIAVYCTSFYLVLTLVYNNHLLHTRNEDGGKGPHEPGNSSIIGYTLNFVVMASGVIISVLGSWGIARASGECEDQGIQACSSLSAVGVLCAGILLAIFGAVAIASLRWENLLKSGTALRLIDMAYGLIAIALIVMGIAMGLAAGLITEVNQEFDMMYSDLLGQYKTTDPNYCTNTATGNELSHDDCYQRLRNDVQSTTESQLGLIGKIVVGVAVYMSILIFLTERAIIQARAGANQRTNSRLTKVNNPMNDDSTSDGVYQKRNAALEAQVKELRHKLAVAHDDTQSAQDDLETALGAAMEANEDSAQLKQELQKLTG